MSDVAVPHFFPPVIIIVAKLLHALALAQTILRAGIAAEMCALDGQSMCNFVPFLNSGKSTHVEITPL